MRHIVLTLTTVVWLLGVSSPGLADPFEQGKVRVSLSGGTIHTYDSTYFVLGGGVGYFVLDGLELGLDGTHWFGGTPSVSKLSPGVQYFLYQLDPFIPYVGGFYKHWFVSDGYRDLDTLGGRVGLVFVVGSSLYLGVGAVHEVIVSSCSGDCSDTYPEVIISLSL